MGNMFPLMDGKEHRLLKERMAEKKMEEEQELGIGSKAQESRSLCDGFHLFRDYNRMFLSFVWNTEEGKGRCVVIDRRIRAWFYF